MAAGNPQPGQLDRRSPREGYSHFQGQICAKYHKEASCCAGCACTDQDVQPDSLSASSPIDALTPKCHPQSTPTPQVLSRSTRRCLLTETVTVFSLTHCTLPCCRSADGTGLVSLGHARTQHTQQSHCCTHQRRNRRQGSKAPTES